MSFRVIVQAEAEGDLDAILSYVAQDSPNQAVRVIGRLELAIRELSEAALRYSLVDRHEDAGIRRRVVGSYKIYYRVKGDVVDILHILHGARDHERLLFSDD